MSSNEKFGLEWLDNILKSLDEPDPEFDAQWKNVMNAKHGEIVDLGVFKVRSLSARISCIETFARLEKKYGISSAEVHNGLAERQAWIAAGNH
jgi:hypothetical protein